ncbi:hypothetical protein G210_0744 [Candida maltosa Xu316]|uniref:Uncharacterized protein n=1 Tax=Candida maltosa (strain Xu316) TaxID=1245528 RepID=M3K6B7_CANMX|nr:hypothetical protein G210_0744 [Candida maltosa Xu316]
MSESTITTEIQQQQVEQRDTVEIQAEGDDFLEYEEEDDEEFGKYSGEVGNDEYRESIDEEEENDEGDESNQVDTYDEGDVSQVVELSDDEDEEEEDGNDEINTKSQEHEEVETNDAEEQVRKDEENNKVDYEDAKEVNADEIEVNDVNIEGNEAVPVESNNQQIDATQEDEVEIIINEKNNVETGDFEDEEMTSPSQLQKLDEFYEDDEEMTSPSQLPIIPAEPSTGETKEIAINEDLDDIITLTEDPEFGITNSTTSAPPIFINYSNQKFLLFPNDHQQNIETNDEQSSPIFEETNYSLTIEELFTELRSNETLNEIEPFLIIEEIILSITEFENLKITEDNLYSKDLTIEDFLNLFNKLKASTQDSSKIPHSLNFNISTQSRFITTFNKLVEESQSVGFDNLDIDNGVDENNKGDDDDDDDEPSVKKRRLS